MVSRERAREAEGARMAVTWRERNGIKGASESSIGSRSGSDIEGKSESSIGRGGGGNVGGDRGG